MPDLSDELRRLAADGAAKARPLPAADVLRQGDRRRRLTVVQLSAGGIALAGLVTTGILVVGSASPAGQGGPGPASGLPSDSFVRSGSVTSKAGTMLLKVRYRRATRGKLDVLSVTVSGHCAKVVRDPFVQVTFGPSSSRHAKLGVGSFGIPVKLGRAGDFRGSMSAHDLRVLRAGQLAGTEPVSATLSSRDQPQSGPADRLLIARTVLTSG